MKLATLITMAARVSWRNRLQRRLENNSYRNLKIITLGTKKNGL